MGWSGGVIDADARCRPEDDALKVNDAATSASEPVQDSLFQVVTIGGGPPSNLPTDATTGGGDGREMSGDAESGANRFRRACSRSSRSRTWSARIRPLVAVGNSQSHEGRKKGARS